MHLLCSLKWHPSQQNAAGTFRRPSISLMMLYVRGAVMQTDVARATSLDLCFTLRVLCVSGGLFFPTYRGPNGGLNEGWPAWRALGLRLGHPALIINWVGEKISAMPYTDFFFLTTNICYSVKISSCFYSWMSVLRGDIMWLHPLT